MPPLRPVILLLLITAAVQAQTVGTASGPVTGHRNGEVHEFLGVPYAAPPVGDLRWRPPVAPLAWTSPVPADAFPPACPQKRYEQGLSDDFTLEGEEDCLYLNVWTPALDGSRPVMVFIHGGGNQQGSSGQLSAGTRIYHGAQLAARGDVVLVTLQYRLGALGFLVHPGLEREDPMGRAGNYGMLDILFALRWVRTNIAAFGGDPGNVTLFGESGGGLNVGNLLTSPQAEGLFHRAIIQSAVPVLESYDVAREEGREFVDRFAPSGSATEKIAALRRVPADDLSLGNKSPLAGGFVQMTWQPVVDQHLFEDFPIDAFEAGAFNRVPLIVGTNADEMRPLAPATVHPVMVDLLIQRLVPAEHRETARELYDPGTTEAAARDAYVGILTDAQFTATARRTARCVSLNQQAPVYRYLFSHTHHPAIPFLGDARSYHGIELFYVFNTWESSPFAIGPWFTLGDDHVQRSTLAYWTTFARTGDPNGGALPTWPAYDAQTDPFLKIEEAPGGSGTGLRTERSDLWDRVAGFDRCRRPGLIMRNGFELSEAGPPRSPMAHGES